MSKEGRTVHLNCMISVEADSVLRNGIRTSKDIGRRVNEAILEWGKNRQQ